MIECQICKAKFKSPKSLQMHLRKTHQFSDDQVKEYYDLYIKIFGEGIDPFTGNETKFIGLTKGYARFDGSEESNKKKIASSTIEYWVKVRGCTKEEAKLILAKKIEKHKKTWSVTDAYDREHNPNYRLKFSWGTEAYILRGYSEEDAKKKHKNASNKRNESIKKLRKLEPERWYDKLETQLGYWLNKGYSEEEAKRLLKKRQTTFSLDKCIKKWGEEDGTKIFNERQTKWKKSLQKNFEREGDGRSPSSKFANEIISQLCNHLKIEKPHKEKWMKCKITGYAYSYDFTYNNKIIEFNGDYWHCNPKIYESSFFNKNKGLTAELIWEYDSEKNNLAKKYGYDVLTIWERDWIDNPKQTIEKCIKFLNKN